MIAMLTSLLLLSTTSATQPAPPSLTPQQFTVALTQLRQEQIAQTGRGRLVEEYESLISSAGANPAAAEAMMDLAGVWDARIEHPHIEPNPAETLRWYRKAAATADPASEVWAQSRLALVWRIEWNDPITARRLLDEIAQHEPGAAPVQAQVQSALVTICVRENKLDEAEQHARTVLGWEDVSARVPADDAARDKLDATIAGTAETIIDALSPASLSVDERASRIKRLMEDFPGVAALQIDGKDALRSLQNSQEARTN